jgi:hypothetical protein
MPKVHVAPSHAVDPSAVNAEALINPESRPSLEHANAQALQAVIKDALPPIFKALSDSADAVGKRLNKPPPVRDQSVALQILSAFVEIVAGAAMGFVGASIASRVKSGLGEHAGAAAGDAFKAVTKGKAAAFAGWWSTEKDPKKTAKARPVAAEPGGTLVEEFITREKRAIDGNELAAKTQMHLVGLGPTPISEDGLRSLAEQLTAFVSAPELTGWFEQKLAMEWLNLCARLSLEDHDDLGTNSVTSETNAGIALRELDGFVDITVEAPSTVDGTKGFKIDSVNAGNVGAADVLRSANNSLARLPVYRRIWISNGPSKVATAPVLLIAPNGEVQADLQSGLLSAIGGGEPVDWWDAMNRATASHPVVKLGQAADAAAGARAIVKFLEGSNLEALQ